MSHIVIISGENLFLEAMSDLLSRELKAETTTMENAKSLYSLDPKQVDMVITTQSLTKPWEGKTLHFRAGEPRRIHNLLSDIAAQLSDKNQTSLTELISLNEKNKNLERIDTGTSIDLTEKEQALLLFIKVQGEAGRDDILKNVWGIAEGVTTHTLETHIYRLRQKWRELADEDPIIATEKGYRWYEA